MSHLSDYRQFIASKRIAAVPSGFDVPISAFNPLMKPFQAVLTQWSLRIGKALLAADTGLGKTLMLLEFAKQVYLLTGEPVLILCPLGVRWQIHAMANHFNIGCPIAVSPFGEIAPGITIANYDRAHLFDARKFAGIILDEGDILASFDSKTRQDLTERFFHTPYKLVCTATPAPNDHMELGNYVEFLNVMTREQMLATFFTHDGGETSKWRLKGHAEYKFWEFLATCAVMIRKPSDIGFSDDGYILPPLNIYEHVVDTPIVKGHLFQASAATLQEQQKARRETIQPRIDKMMELIDTSRPYIVWCNLNDESTAARAALADYGCVEITGSQLADLKESRLFGFAEGTHQGLVTKSEIAGHGMNWQHCNQEFFLGLGHSWRRFYQSVRRCWRFGQKLPVDVHVIVSDRDESVLQSHRRKQEQADKMAAGMIQAMSVHTRKNLGSANRMAGEYKPTIPMEIPAWLTATGKQQRTA